MQIGKCKWKTGKIKNLCCLRLHPPPPPISHQIATCCKTDGGIFHLHATDLSLSGQGIKNKESSKEKHVFHIHNLTSLFPSLVTETDYLTDYTQQSSLHHAGQTIECMSRWLGQHDATNWFLWKPVLKPRNWFRGRYHPDFPEPEDSIMWLCYICCRVLRHVKSGTKWQFRPAGGELR